MVTQTGDVEAKSALELALEEAVGIVVNRETATLPQTTDGALFTITGGRIELLGIVGEVTTVIQTQANNTKIKFNPDGAGADTDLCAVLDISADAVGTYYGITGTVSDAMIEGIQRVNAMTTPQVLSAGAIELDCAASNTGSVKWQVRYRPIDEGAVVTAA